MIWANEKDDDATSADERHGHRFSAQTLALQPGNVDFQPLARFEQNREGSPHHVKRTGFPTPVQRQYLPWRNHPEGLSLYKREERDHSQLRTVAHQIRSYSCICSLSASRKLFRARQSRVSTAWRVRPVFAASSSVLANLK